MTMRWPFREKEFYPWFQAHIRTLDQLSNFLDEIARGEHDRGKDGPPPEDFIRWLRRRHDRLQSFRAKPISKHNWML